MNLKIITKSITNLYKMQRLMNRKSQYFVQKEKICNNWEIYISVFYLSSVFQYPLSKYLRRSFVILVISCSYLDEKAIQRQILTDYDLHVCPRINNVPLKVYHELKVQWIVKYVSYTSYLFCVDGNICGCVFSTIRLIR